MHRDEGCILHALVVSALPLLAMMVCCSPRGYESLAALIVFVSGTSLQKSLSGKTGPV
jgi:hypothetical protein